MKKENHEEKKTDVEECRDKINTLLEEYNCSLHASDEFSWVYIEDNDTGRYEGDLK